MNFSSNRVNDHRVTRNYLAIAFICESAEKLRQKKVVFASNSVTKNTIVQTLELQMKIITLS